MERKQSLTERLGSSLRTAIVEGSVLAGTMLTEAPLAELIGSSRVPVRNALKELMAEGLIHRSGPRGYIVGPPGSEIIRAPLEQSLKSLSILQAPRQTFAWQPLYDEVEARVVHRSFFGRARINEHELARHFGVGRTVAHDVLSRLEKLGLIEKDDVSRWSIVPLDETRIRELYEIREHLEPIAIAGALTNLSDDEITEMRTRHVDGLARYPEISAAEMYNLEVALHVDCVQRTQNRELAKILQRTHCLLTLSKHTVGTKVAKLPREAFFDEHIAVFDRMLARQQTAVEIAARDHIRSSVANVIERAEMVRRDENVASVSYIT